MSVEELIKRAVDEINGDYECGARQCIKDLIYRIIKQQAIIMDAEVEIKKIQGALKAIEVKQVPSNFLV